MNPEFLETIAKRVAADAESLRGLRLISVCLAQRLFDHRFLPLREIGPAWRERAGERERRRIGEHIGRAYLWSEQGETGEAVLEGLYAVKDASEGFVAAVGVAAPVAGAIEKKLAAGSMAAADTAIADSAAADSAAGGPKPAPVTPEPVPAEPPPEPAPPPPATPPPTTAVTTWEAHEAAVTNRIKALNPGAAVPEQVYLDVKNLETGVSKRIRIDAIYKNPAGDYQLVDAKFSSVKDLTTGNLKSTLTENQKLAYQWIKDGKAAVSAADVPSAASKGFAGGQSLTVTSPVQIHVNSPTGIVVRPY